MKLLTSKKANQRLNVLINSAVLGLILLVVLFSIYATVMPEAQSAGASMNISNTCVADGCAYNASNTWWNATPEKNCIATAGETNDSCTTFRGAIPLSGLFNAGGAIFIIVMAALLVLVVRSYLKGKK